MQYTGATLLAVIAMGFVGAAETTASSQLKEKNNAMELVEIHRSNPSILQSYLPVSVETCIRRRANVEVPGFMYDFYTQFIKVGIESADLSDRQYQEKYKGWAVKQREMMLDHLNRLPVERRAENIRFFVDLAKDQEPVYQCVAAQVTARIDR